MSATATSRGDAAVMPVAVVSGSSQRPARTVLSATTAFAHGLPANMNASRWDRKNVSVTSAAGVNLTWESVAFGGRRRPVPGPVSAVSEWAAYSIVKTHVNSLVRPAAETTKCLSNANPMR